MLKIIKYLSYNENKSKKNYIKCTKFKVLTFNQFYHKFLLVGHPEGPEVEDDEGRVQKLKRRPRSRPHGSSQEIA